MEIGYNKIFLDTAPFIYYLENNPQYFDIMKDFLLECINKKINLVTSTITVEEYLVFPFKTENEELCNNFFTFLEDLQIDIIAINKEIAINAAKIRSIYPSLKSMDVLQISTYELTRCDLFLTNDIQLKNINDINCMLVDDLNTNN